MFLGRPTAIKTSDLEVYALAKRFERLGTCMPNGPEPSLETQTYEALIELMEIGNRASDVVHKHPAPSPANRDLYRQLAVLDKELTLWYARLPQGLKWEQENINTASRAFFILHQQYHCVHITLRRPFARYEDIESDDPASKELAAESTAVSSRKACTSHAIAVVKNFWQYRQRFPLWQIFCGALASAVCSRLSSNVRSAHKSTGNCVHRARRRTRRRARDQGAQQYSQVYQVHGRRAWRNVQHILPSRAYVPDPPTRSLRNQPKESAPRKLHRPCLAAAIGRWRDSDIVQAAAATLTVTTQGRRQRHQPAANEWTCCQCWQRIATFGSPVRLVRQRRAHHASLLSPIPQRHNGGGQHVAIPEQR